uniref:Histone deacetylase complex subunit SAP30 Sin3 binding domain-containing protein n=1 Tax=Opuntia streptacantha TaxID=393608 RepID=A0A7C9EV85_OPUST
MKMIESELCAAATRVISPFREESGDEELSVLPRHTKVVVTGNNRTKSVLVGLQGVVKKAVGLGGWHWLVLKNGIEVKLQRNALSVLEPPTGNEEDDELDHSSSSSDLIDKEPDFPSSLEFHKVSKPRVRHTRPWAQSALAKSNNRSCFKEFHCNFHAPHCRLNFTKLGSDSVWRYLSRFHLGSTNSTSSREHLVNIVQRHFASQQVDEAQVIAEFVRAAKKLRANNGSRE